MAETLPVTHVLKTALHYGDLTLGGLSAKLAELKALMTPEEQKDMDVYLANSRNLIMEPEVDLGIDSFEHIPGGDTYPKIQELMEKHPRLAFAFKLASETVRAERGWDLQDEYRSDWHHLNIDAGLSPELFQTVFPFTLPGF